MKGVGCSVCGGGWRVSGERVQGVGFRVYVYFDERGVKGVGCRVSGVGSGLC